MFAPFCSATNFYSIICTANKSWEMHQKIIGHLLLLGFANHFKGSVFKQFPIFFFVPISKRSKTKTFVYCNNFWRITELLEKNINQIGYFVYCNECLGKNFLRCGLLKIAKNEMTK